MKAFLLVAGEGTRLRPLTWNVPKCLVPILGRPLLHYWFKLCQCYGIDSVLLNLHHLPEKVEEFLKTNNYGLQVRMTFEPELLGSAGTIRANWDFVEKEESFFIFYGDNLTNVRLDLMREFHQGHRGLLTMGLFQSSVPKECGIVQLAPDGLVLEFVEKPEEPRSNLANAGIFLARAGILDFIPDGKGVDLGYHVLPVLVGKMYGWLVQGYLRDIGSAKSYEQAQQEWQCLGEDD